jgi:LmbE family N-acetylglucosaminyl deacetylase
MPSALAIFAHPDDIEFVAAGTLLQLARRGWKLHYLNLCSGSGGSVQMDASTTAAMRLIEAQEAARLLGATFHLPISDDLELTYSVEALRKVAAVVRVAQPSIVLTHSPQDYMEDHMNAARLAVTAAFAHGIPNFQTDPPCEAYLHDVTVYHAMPHGLCDPLRQKLRAGLYVDSYLVSMDKMSRAVGQLSGRFEHAEGWRRHLHLGFSASDADPLSEALGNDCCVDEVYEAALGLHV